MLEIFGLLLLNEGDPGQAAMCIDELVDHGEVAGVEYVDEEFDLLGFFEGIDGMRLRPLAWMMAMRWV